MMLKLQISGKRQSWGRWSHTEVCDVFKEVNTFKHEALVRVTQVVSGQGTCYTEA